MIDPGLAGRVAIVTGSSRGIGLGIAERLAELGCVVVMNGRHADTLRTAADAIRASGATVDEVVADVGLFADVQRLVRHLLDRHGRIDVLVNNAASANPVAHLLELDPWFWSDVIRSNLTSVFLCTRLVAEEMVRARIAGSVVNVSSFGGIRSHRSLTAYDSAKGGIEAFTRSAALDLAPFGIRVNSVAPGPIRTEATGGSDEMAARRGALLPQGHIGVPRDVADAVVYLASEQAQFITGQTLVVDGGALAQIRPPGVDTPSLTQHDVEVRPRLLDRDQNEVDA